MMNKDDGKKLDEMTAEEVAAETPKAANELASEELKQVNGGLATALYHYSNWHRKEEEKKKANAAKATGSGASGGW